MKQKKKVYQKVFELVKECDSQKEALELVREIKLREGIKGHKEFKII